LALCIPFEKVKTRLVRRRILNAKKTITPIEKRATTPVNKRKKKLASFAEPFAPPGPAGGKVTAGIKCKVAFGEALGKGVGVGIIKGVGLILAS
jgi:hypothetical protein